MNDLQRIVHWQVLRFKVAIMHSTSASIYLHRLGNGRPGRNAFSIEFLYLLREIYPKL